MTARFPTPRPVWKEAGSRFRRRTTEDHLATVVEMTDAAFVAATELIRLENPDFTEEEIHLAAVRQRVGDPVFERAFREAPPA